MICIYSITNKINGKVYVGQAYNYAKRHYEHIKQLSNNKHEAKLLQEDFNKYGEGKFEFKVEQECKLEELNELEIYYISKLNAFEDNGGYNATTGGKSGYKMSQRAKKEMSEKTKEVFNTPEIKENRSKIMTERYENPEERKKTAEATKVGMAKMSKEQLSRTCLSKLPNETLIQMTKERYLTREEMAKKFNTSIANAKSIKEETHWIYKYMKENNIPIIKFPKKKNFRSSISTDILLQIVKDKEMNIPELFKKYNISKKILTNVKLGQNWIYEYIELNNINLDDID